MKSFTSTSLICDGRTLLLLDQTLLPHTEQWIHCNTIDILFDAITRLAVRGAPAIGIAAAIFLALQAEQGTSPQALEKMIGHLRKARPTAVNLSNNLQAILHSLHLQPYPQATIMAAEAIYNEDIHLCQRIAKNGLACILSGTKLLTHCNTGGLATAGTGTAFAILLAAHQHYHNIFLWLDETRPLLQGSRLTAWECVKNNIPHSIICDNAAAFLMAQGEVDGVFVGCDRIATNGDFANKIGTYGLAVLAHSHSIPFYVAGPQTSVDPHCPNGSHIPIELRSEKEITACMGMDGSIPISCPGSPAYNPAFDITPAHLVTAWILDSGVYTQHELSKQNWWQG